MIVRSAYQRMAADRYQAIHRRDGKYHLAGENPEEAETEEKDATPRVSPPSGRLRVEIHCSVKNGSGYA